MCSHSSILPSVFPLSIIAAKHHLIVSREPSKKGSYFLKAEVELRELLNLVWIDVYRQATGALRITLRIFVISIAFSQRIGGAPKARMCMNGAPIPIKIADKIGESPHVAAVTRW
jgi:hypothetical protein